MQKQSCSFLLLSGLVGALALVGAEVGRAQTAQQSLWSDPATWPNSKVPVAGDKVTIGRDKDVILDVSPPALGGLSIDGKLTFAWARSVGIFRVFTTEAWRHGGT
jgi:hypothetical protein